MSVNSAYAIMSVLAAGIAFGVSALLGIVLIPWLQRLKFGQTIKEIGPTWHQKKQGTPTMGGIMFIAGIVLAIAVCIPCFFAMAKTYEISTELKVKLWAGVALAIVCGVMGFLDDYTGIKKKENTGLTVKQKFALQFLTAGLFLGAIAIAEKGAGKTYIPFVGEVELGIWFYLIALVLIVGFINAVNLTDGIDGLCGSVTFFAEICFMLIAALNGLFHVGILAASVAGGCLGFLVWNFHPAKVFMGDTGSLFLGGIFCATAFACDMPILIPLVGIIYLCETGSVMLQTTYFKLTHGKRIFKMTPIHHSFEMSGWSEVKIVTVFSLVTVVCGGIACLLAALG